MFVEFAGDDEPRFVAGARVPVAQIRERLLAARDGDRPVVIAVNGRSASGKSTLAARLADASGWCVLATDDLAWWHSFFGWADLMREVLEPARRGEAVSMTPPAWREHGRRGVVEVPAGCEAIVVEGVGSSRRELADLLDAAIWVHTALTVIEAREVHRIATGHVSTSLQHDWMTEELAVLADDRPWSRADLVISGTDCDERGVLTLEPA